MGVNVVLSGNRRSLKVRASQAAQAAAVVASLAGLLIGVSASGAQAAQGGGAVSGSSGGVRPADCSSVGGGTWCRGTYLSGLWKHCYSNYTHPTNYHSSTAIIANDVEKGYAGAGYWSYADAYAGWAYTCYTYWNNEA